MKIKKQLKNICSFCYGDLEKEFLDLDKTPLANSYTKNPLKLKKHNLKLFFCKNCLLVQHNTKLSGENIFSDYQYFSSYSSNFVALAKKNVLNLIKKYKLGSKNTVIEIASNDGYLLKHLKKIDINFYGIEPAKNIAEIANKRGIKTINEYLNKKTTIKIIKENPKGDLIIANNVFAHVPKIDEFIKSIKILMTEKSIVCIEVPHLLNLIKNKQFDTIYHEHFFYLSLLSIRKMFNSNEMKIINVDKIKTHGGSLRVHITNIKNKIKINDNVKKILTEETNYNLKNMKSYITFSASIYKLREEIIDFFNKNAEKNIYGFGAAAKSCTLINFCSLNLNKIKYIYDETPAKIGKYIPGTDIKIIKFGKNLPNKIDMIVIFPWNHLTEIKNKIEKITTNKIKLVTLIPTVKEHTIN